MTSLPRPGAAADLHGNTVRIVHGPIRLAIVTDEPLPPWAWPQIADLAAFAASLAEQLTNGRPGSVHVEWLGNAATDDQAAAAVEGDIPCGDSTPDVAPEGGAAAEPPPAAEFEVFDSRRRYQRVDCPDCGKNVSRAQLTNHRHYKHPTPPPAPKPPDARAWAAGPSSEVAKPEPPHVMTHESRVANDELIVDGVHRCGAHRSDGTPCLRRTAPGARCVHHLEDDDGLVELQAELDDLELTDPDVARAAANLRELTGEPAPTSTSDHDPKCDCIRCHVRRRNEARALTERAAADAEAAGMTWGVHGESPPKVEHWSRHENEP